MSESPQTDRELTDREASLVRWMLEHGSAEARTYLTQLARAHVTPWRCACGCASINFSIDGEPAPNAGPFILADFIFGADQNLSGIFVFQRDGFLSGLEVYGLAGDAPTSLPVPNELRPFEGARISA
jgi:hypothetical protein